MSRIDSFSVEQLTEMAKDNEKKLIRYFLMLRKKKKISQGAYAESCGMLQQAISRLEKGNQGITLLTACKMANALGYEVMLVRKKKSEKDDYGEE